MTIQGRYIIPNPIPTKTFRKNITKFVYMVQEIKGGTQGRTVCTAGLPFRCTWVFPLVLVGFVLFNLQSSVYFFVDQCLFYVVVIFLLIIILSVILQFAASDYPQIIFKLFFFLNTNFLYSQIFFLDVSCSLLISALYVFFN